MDASAYALAMSLSTAAGIRPFLTLAVCAWLMYAGYLHPSAHYTWIGSAGIAALLAVLAALDFFADKVPILDHALHAVHFATTPVAAALIVGSTIPAGDPTTATYVTMGLAALNALGIHTASAATRAASTSVTAGVGNPFVSMLEDVGAVLVIATAFILPFLGLALSVLVLILLVRFAMRRRTRTAAGRAR
jgi:hypothetical protein